MPALTTITDVEAELADTADWRYPLDIDKAKRRVNALTRKLDFPQEAERDGVTVIHWQQGVQKQIDDLVIAIGANATPTDAQRLANPDVVHADFSTFGRYGSC